jgi:hypothetical protein
VWENKKKTQLHWKLYQLKFNLNAHKPSHKKASKLTSKKRKQEKTRNKNSASMHHSPHIKRASKHLKE